MRNVDPDTTGAASTVTVVEGGVRLGNGEIVPPPAGISAEEFAGKLNALAERRQAQRTAPEEQKEVTLTEALEKIGVTNITGSLADYGNVRTEQNMASFYLHEVLAADGNIIMEMKEAPVSVKTGFSQETDITGNDTEASGENVPKNGGAVNTAEELLEGNTEEQSNALKEILNGAQNAVIGEGRNRVSVTVEQEKRGEG